MLATLLQRPTHHKDGAGWNHSLDHSLLLAPCSGPPTEWAVRSLEPLTETDCHQQDDREFFFVYLAMTAGTGQNTGACERDSSVSCVDCITYPSHQHTQLLHCRCPLTMVTPSPRSSTDHNSNTRLSKLARLPHSFGASGVHPSRCHPVTQSSVPPAQGCLSVMRETGAYIICFWNTTKSIPCLVVVLCRVSLRCRRAE